MNCKQETVNGKKDIHGGNPSAIAGKLGIDKIPDIKYDFSVNINPFGMPLAVERKLLGMTDSDFSDYPDIYAEIAVKALADVHGIPLDSVLIGNGSTEVFSWIVNSIAPSKAHCIAPCYSGYSEICRAAGIPLEIAKFAKPEEDFKIRLDDIDYSEIELLFVCTPNNPTGVLIDPQQILETARNNSNTFFIVDESFIDFVGEEKSIIAEKVLPENIAVVKSLTKFFALAGVRLGMVYSNPEFINRLTGERLPWSVNAMAQEVAPLLYKDKKYICESRKKICELRKKLSAKLAEIEGIKVFPGEADFVLCELSSLRSPNAKSVLDNSPSGGRSLRSESANYFCGTALDLQKHLLRDGILIRSCADVKGLGDSFFRVAVKLERDNDLLVNSISNIQQGISNNQVNTEEHRTSNEFKSQHLNISTSHNPLMVVGTTSDAGKSVVAAGLCRIFARKGIKVAPFKAQNMSLNSFVTKEGGEMGRAQVVQAEAAGIDPHTDMNPVLLKPTGDAGSQLIVNGKPVCNVTAKGYYEEKCELRKDAQDAFDRLAARFDMIILEGAGSPAEINLQDKDFVNMAMAEHANAKTILVADINPGGVFASIYGTVKLIPSRYRKYLSGIIINKFRGDVSLLNEGIEEIEELTGIPVLGVLPYIQNLNIEEEDSMGLDSDFRQGEIPEGMIDIAVIRLPRISNFTDFFALETAPGVSLRYVSQASKLAKPDLVIIPGSKNTISDMKWLRESGFENKMKNLHTPIFGVCGGFQMLGQIIKDPDNVEGDLQEIKGLGLLPLETVLAGDKELSQVKGTVENLPFAEKGTEFQGYEIHVGRTDSISNIQHGISNDQGNTREHSTSNHNVGANPSIRPLIITNRKGNDWDEAVGYVSEDGLVFGSYVHGIFDGDDVRTQLLEWLVERNPEIKEFNPESTGIDKEQVYDRLADMIEKYIDLDKIF